MCTKIAKIDFREFDDFDEITDFRNLPFPRENS
jgi:hypothetical protein